MFWKGFWKYDEKQIAEMQRNISVLNSLLETEREKNALIDSTPLPKCQGAGCAACEYVVYKRIRSRVFILGCGKDAVCEHFKPRSAPANEDIQQQLTEALI